MKSNEQTLDEMCFLDDQLKPIKNYTLLEMIEMAKQSDYGYVWYSDKGPIQINRDGSLIPFSPGPNDPILNPEWVVNLRSTK